MITKDSKTILVADDSIFFRTKLSDMLVEAGHKVRFAKDGREVINEIKIDSEGLDLLILDLQMPDMDGFEVLKWINDNGHRDSFPVLVVTGVYEPTEVMDRLKELGAAGLMSKAFTPEHTIFMVNRTLFSEKASHGVHRIRVPVSIPMDFHVGENRHTGFLLNISENGVFLHTKVELLTGSVVQLKFSLPGYEKVFEVKGIVRWTTTEVANKTLFGGSGVMFTSVDPADYELIKEFVIKEGKRLGLVEGYTSS
ncbi:MAG TPA: response regulator [Thermodesulfobacteriota bacterium]|nr:response regulator [Thermodesulfobacteriota bacterium]